MIKVYKLKTVLNALLAIILIAGFILILKNKFDTYESIQTSSNSTNSYKILVDVEDSKLFLFQNGELIKTYKCSGGKVATPSPIGSWTIISKAKWGEGFGGSWLRIKCSMGTIWNTWHIKYIFCRMGKFPWMYKNE